MYIYSMYISPIYSFRILFLLLILSYHKFLCLFPQKIPSFHFIFFRGWEKDVIFIVQLKYYLANWHDGGSQSVKVSYIHNATQFLCMYCKLQTRKFVNRVAWRRVMSMGEYINISIFLYFPSYSMLCLRGFATNDSQAQCELFFLLINQIFG